eukprot:scaffold27.g6019.t1
MVAAAAVTTAERQTCAASKALAEEKKLLGNTYFKDKHYAQAVEAYSEAIQLDPTNHVLYSNRAFAELRLEQPGACIVDATKALELSPTYAKAYYRRADAAFALARWRDAVRDFRAAAKLSPNDPDLRRKLAEAEKELRRELFEAALSTEHDHKPTSDGVVLEDFAIEESYRGPHLEEVKGEAVPAEHEACTAAAAAAAAAAEAGSSSSFAQLRRYRITPAFVEAMLHEFREQRLIHRRYAFWIVLEAQRLLRQLPSLVDLEVPEGTHITVCGDTHGQFYDLLRIFELGGAPSPSNPYLFNGDFVDRGSFSVEVILTLLAYKCLHPEAMHLTRGNHEARSMAAIYGFYNEVKAKYASQTLVDVFRETFCHLPLGYVLNSKVLVVHGGPPCGEPGVTLDQMRTVDRNREPPEAGIMCEMLWNDPQPEEGVVPNKRGVGVAFGPDACKCFLQANELEMVVRSHEVKPEGFEVAHDGFCITVFSAPNYCDQCGNQGAFIRFFSDLTPQFTTFDAAPHPPVPALKYAAHSMHSMFGI